MDDPYLVLRIEPGAKPEAIRKQYRFLVKAFHPDRFDTPEYKLLAEEEIKRINRAYQILSTPREHSNGVQSTGTANYSRTNTNNVNRKAEEVARQRTREEQRKKAEEATRQRAQTSQKKEVEEASLRYAQEEQRKKAEEAIRQQVQEEQEKIVEEATHRRAQEEQRKKAGEAIRQPVQEAKAKNRENVANVETPSPAIWHINLSWNSWTQVWLLLLFSISFYLIFNTIVSFKMSLILAVAFGFVGSKIINFAIQKHQINMLRTWIEEKLAEINRITKNEVKGLNTVEQLDEMLKPIALQFGTARVDKVKEMLRKQAEIGIKLKLLDSTPNESKRNEIGKVINSLRTDIEALRKEIGPACMQFVHRAYLKQDGKIWDGINASIAKSRTGQKRGEMFE